MVIKLRRSACCRRNLDFISLEKTPTSISGEYRNKYVSVGVQSPTEIKASGGLQECADENVSKADAHSAARTLGAFLNRTTFSCFAGFKVILFHAGMKRMTIASYCDVRVKSSFGAFCL